MKRKLLIWILLFILSVGTIITLTHRYFVSLRNTKIVEDYIVFLLNTYTPSDTTYDKANYGWNTEETRNNWTYFNGLVMYSFAKNEKFRRLPRIFYHDIITDDGKVNDQRLKTNIYKLGEVDSILPARTLFLLDYKNTDKFRKALDFSYNNLKQIRTIPALGNNFVHKENNYWKEFPIALDSLYMAVPFYAEYTANSSKLSEKQKQDNYNDIYKKMDWIANNLKADNGLYYHGISSDGKRHNGIVWLRAVGWYAMAQVEVIANMPNGENKDKMIAQFKSFADAMLKYQDKKTGMWKNVVYPDVISDCNKFETSGTLMMAYTLLKAYNDGYLHGQKYLNAGLKAYNNTVKYKLEKDVSGYILSDIYLISGVNDISDKYCKCNGYRTNEAKGIAPLILCTEEVKRHYKIK